LERNGLNNPHEGGRKLRGKGYELISHTDTKTESGITLNHELMAYVL
jgi:hypothetical protein